MNRIRDRQALLEASLFYRECVICGSTDDLQVHHILFRSQGGDDVAANLAGLCLYHHDKIHARDHRAWYLLGVYVSTQRDDTMEYLVEKLGISGAEVFFA